jgi:solute carrier family 8 (sodium/calcium exchanger)
MGILVYRKGTFYNHQRYLLIPSITGFWRKYQNKILESLQGKKVILAGDGRHDSMGHSAKYCTYTIFCCTVGLLIHIELVQVTIPYLLQSG